MSRVDEEIRDDIQRLTQPVRTDGVLDRVAWRKARRRVVWRLQTIGIAIAVVVGSVAGIVGLSHVFARPDVRTPGEAPRVTEPAPSPTGNSQAGADVEAICDESQLVADVDGDGALDAVAVWSPATKCDTPEVGQQYVIHISGGKLADMGGQDVRFYGIEQDLAECEQAFACRLFAARDLDSDGAAELAVQVARRGAIRTVVLYRAAVDPAHDRYELVRIRVAAPGDPWSQQFGIPPGPAAFAWGSSAGERHAVSCDEQEGERRLVVTTSMPSAQMPGAYDVHQTLLRLSGDELTVVDTNDQTASEIQPPMANDLCGAPIL